MDKNERLQKLLRSVREHTKMIQEFKHDMYMRYNNTDSQDKKDKILEKIQNIEQVMLVVYEKYKSEYRVLVLLGTDVEQLKYLIKVIMEFYEEVLSLR